jgi:hypothetical protein
MTACAYCFSTNGHHVQCPNFQTTTLATTQDEQSGPIVWILATGEDDKPENECERGDCLGIHRSPDGYRDCDGKSI